MTEPTFRYQTPSAFRTALKERFGQIARTDRLSIPQAAGPLTAFGDRPKAANRGLATHPPILSQR